MNGEPGEGLQPGAGQPEQILEFATPLAPEMLPGPKTKPAGEGNMTNSGEKNNATNYADFLKDMGVDVEVFETRASETAKKTGEWLKSMHTDANGNALPDQIIDQIDNSLRHKLAADEIRLRAEISAGKKYDPDELAKLTMDADMLQVALETAVIDPDKLASSYKIAWEQSYDPPKNMRVSRFVPPPIVEPGKITLGSIRFFNDDGTEEVPEGTRIDNGIIHYDNADGSPTTTNGNSEPPKGPDFI